MSPPSAVSPSVSLNGNGPVHLKTAFLGLTVGSIGVVYGDIGTSPLYALREAVTASIEPGGMVNREAVFGVLSLILWALIVTVTLKYVLVLLRADNNGEGGTLALMALAQRALRKGANAIVLLRHHQRGAVLRRRHDHAGALGAVRDRGSQDRHAGLRSLHRAPDHGGPGRAVCGAIARDREGRGLLRPDHGAVVRRHRGCRPRPCGHPAGDPARLQSVLCGRLPGRATARSGSSRSARCFSP